MTLRDVTLKNRIVISPMQQYAAGRDGLPLDYHVAHYGRLAMGGAGLVFTEALCTSEQGRLTYSDLGSWDDACIERLARIAATVRDQGSTPERARPVCSSKSVSGHMLPSATVYDSFRS